MDDRPVAEFKGEVFDKVTVYPSIVKFTKARSDFVMNLSRREVYCLNQKPCRDKECRFYINNKEFKNCVLNIDRTFTLEEIGDMHEVSREAIRQAEERAIRKFRKRIKALAHVRSLRDLLPEKPEFVVREKRGRYWDMRITK